VTAPLDTGLEFYRQVLALRGYRQEILSADLANASTPGFKAVDLDFAEALRAARGGDAGPDGGGRSAGAGDARLWRVDDPRHFQPGGRPPTNVMAQAAGAVKYQAGTSVTLDGNSVDLDQTKLAAAANAVDYAAAAAFTTQTIRMLMTAIAGAPAQPPGGA
jgi:flagellar basal-body rod protein FlgB